jgi:hypothetical protein
MRPGRFKKYHRKLYTAVSSDDETGNLNSHGALLAGFGNEIHTIPPLTSVQLANFCVNLFTFRFDVGDELLLQQKRFAPDIRCPSINFYLI